jgi:polar amino acid transport system substrate-binding protein
MHWRWAIIGLMGVAAPQADADQPDLTILFHVRPPYSYYGLDHQVAGLLPEAVSSALAKAGLSADWVEMPPARQTEEIKRGREATCALGWFKRPEREAFASFSDPIYHDRQTIVVARKNDARFANGMSLQDSFRDPARALIVKTAYSYGATIDGWIKALRPRAEATSVANELLLGMVAQSRVDYAIMAPEEAEDLLGSHPQLRASLHAVELGDAPDGELRYLMCSLATSAALIERINGALAR